MKWEAFHTYLVTANLLVHVNGQNSLSRTTNITNITPIFIQREDLISQTTYVTLRVPLNLTKLVMKTKEVCIITAMMHEFVTEIMKNYKSMLSSNRKIISILRKTLENLCDEDLEAFQELIDIFSLIEFTTETQI